jgi:light-regulated signal transduction histidine kinase (bacteriophytochrome)
VHTIQTSLSPIYTTEGGVDGLVGVGRNITEIKRAEDAISTLNNTLLHRTIALEAVNKELEAFSYSVSHDLRAPLRAISGYSRILQEEYRAKLDSEAQHFLDRIRTNVERMGMLIDDLLAFSRLGRQPLRRREVQPASLVSDVIQELRQEFGGELRPTIRLEDLPPCLADPALLKRVYANLLENAVKFTRDCEDPQVSVGAVEDNNETIYYVKDNGVGFDMRYVDKLFGVFQRLHDPDRYEGTGIGLATSRRIIQRHGGRIWAESKVGQGTTFYFTIGDESMDDPLGG